MLTQSQKSQCVQLTGLGVAGSMSSAEYLASTIRNAVAYAAATDTVAMSAILIADIQAFRAANGSAPITLSPGFQFVNQLPAQIVAENG